MTSNAIDYGQYTIGRVVRMLESDGNNIYGHVMGFHLSHFNEILIRVLWAGDTGEVCYHPSYIELV